MSQHLSGKNLVCHVVPTVFLSLRNREIQEGEFKWWNGDVRLA